MIEYSLYSGQLPSGVTLNTSTGELSGTPTEAGTFVFQIEAADDVTLCSDIQAYTVIISEANSSFPVISTSSSLPPVCENSLYSTTFYATGGFTPYSWTSDPLPTNLALNSTTGNLYGTIAEAAGDYTFDVTVTDVALNSFTKTFTLTVNALPSIVTTTLPNGEEGTPYSQTILSSNAGPSAEFSLANSSTLPDGLVLNSTTGEISGTPTTLGDYLFYIKLDNLNGCSDTKAFSLRITGVGLPPTINGTFPTQCKNVYYSGMPTISDGTSPFVCFISAGSLPAGLSVVAHTGEVRGIPTQSGVFNFDITVEDALLLSGSNSFSLEIYDSPVIQEVSALGAIWNTPYDYTFTRIGGAASIIWNLTGTLPSGLVFNTLFGSLSGTPYEYGTYPLTISVTDSNGCSDTKSFVLEVSGPPVILTDSLMPACQNIYYSAFILVSEGTPPFIWDIYSINYPPNNITLNPYTGELSGIPETPGTYYFVIRVNDKNHLYYEKQYTLIVRPEAECAGLIDLNNLTPEGIEYIQRQKPRLISAESAPVVVVDPFHQKHLYEYLPTPFIEE